MLIKLISKNRDLLLNLIVSDIRTRYFGSVAGLSVTIIQPLFLLLIYSFVFSAILKVKFNTPNDIGDFALYLFCGLIPWLGISEAAQRSSSVLLDKKSLIKKVLFPKEILPIFLTLSGFFYQSTALFILIIVLGFKSLSINYHLLIFLVIFPMQILFTLGLCFFLSSLNIFFRDIGIFLPSFLHLWLFCTPIFYPYSMIPEQFITLMELNPLFHLVRIYRSILLQNAVPTIHHIFYFLIFSILLFLMGYLLFLRLKERIVDFI